MLDTITTIFLYMSLLGLFCLGLLVFWQFLFEFCKTVVDAVKWVVGRVRNVKS